MRGLAGSSELQAENNRLKSEMSSRDASPFLGQRTIDKRVEQALHAEFIKDRDGPVAAMEALLGAYPAVSVAFLASLARTKTGQDGHNAFYRHLEEALGVDETTHDMRRRLWRPTHADGARRPPCRSVWEPGRTTRETGLRRPGTPRPRRGPSRLIPRHQHCTDDALVSRELGGRRPEGA